MMDLKFARGLLGLASPGAPGRDAPPSMSALPGLVNRLAQGRTEAVGRAFQRPYIDHPTFEWSPSVEALDGSMHGRALGIWSALARRPHASSPSVADFDIVAFRPMLGNLMLLEPVDDGEDFVYRVYGTNIARFVGLEMTGKRLTNGPLPPFAQALFLVGYRAVLKRQEPLLSRHVAPTDFVMATWDRLILPFVDEDSMVTRLLVVNEPVRTAPAPEYFTK